MGQIYIATAYDIAEMKCCTIYADKFHANCYTYSEPVVSIHYLLRQKPYNVMWGGQYVAIDDNLAHISCERILLGISTYEDYESFENNNDNLQEKSYYDKVKFIDENSKRWDEMKESVILSEATEYFDMDNTSSVKWSGYLVNHTQKLVIDLADYYKKSKFTVKDRTKERYGGAVKDVVAAIDPIPVLTDTGDGAQMAYLDGVYAISTEHLAGTWCGDLLQIVDDLDETTKNYTLIDCCFADMWQKARHFFEAFGVNEDNLILTGELDEDGNKKLYEAAALTFWGERRFICNIKSENKDGKVVMNTVSAKKSERSDDSGVSV